MRPDILELDQEGTPTQAPTPLTLQDAESLRLLLTGQSVIDWQWLAFNDLSDVDRFLRTLLIDLDDPVDLRRLRYVFNEAVTYCHEVVDLRVPPELRKIEDVRQIFLHASRPSGFRRSQVISCVLLKLMHVIHHMEAADLRFRVSISEAELVALAQARLVAQLDALRESGLPILTFYGSQKSRGSTVGKLLAKAETVAATIFDKLRFRVVVPTQHDLVPVLATMAREVFPFNYIIPRQSHNTLLPLQEVRARLPESLRDALQQVKGSDLRQESNVFSAGGYQVINFIADIPVRPPAKVLSNLAPHSGRVVFVQVELQVVDEATARSNEEGDNAHHKYKRRQFAAVQARLKRGAAIRRR